ncbi:PadR family transcriptional regulator [Hominifimenecus sp. rT4P-3]|uniref:PadR family transcriptional regulator n=1 Tax=Hominifimenecus sp. rT4P-3 TaxID=3242979 RepID=UPI003DA1CF84
MRTLKYAILGLMKRGPISGYDIAREFSDNALASFWHARHSQIYPELKRLLDEGLITYETVIQGEKLEKKVYSLTPQGEADFQQWLRSDEPLDPTPKDVFRLRTYYSDSLNTDEYLHLLDSQIKHHMARLDALEEINRRFPQIPPRKTPEHGDYLVLQGALMREKAYLDWLELCRRSFTET